MRLRPSHMGLAGLAAAMILLVFWMLADIPPEDAPFNEKAKTSVPGGVAKAAEEAVDITTAGADKSTEAALKQAIHLYFIDEDGRHLVAETRTVMRPSDPAAFGRQIVLALLEGPRSQRGRSLPEETDLRSFFLGEDGTAYVDFSVAVSHLHPGGGHHPGGVTLERLSIYSLVNSLVLNSDRIKAVRILIDGRAAETLAGHVDLQRSFNANMLMIK